MGISTAQLSQITKGAAASEASAQHTGIHQSTQRPTIRHRGMRDDPAGVIARKEMVSLCLSPRDKHLHQPDGQHWRLAVLDICGVIVSGDESSRPPAVCWRLNARVILS